jgi:glutaminyl-tRNA synthetase
VPLSRLAQASAGVGVVVTPEQLRAAVAEALAGEAVRLRELRYRAPPGPLLVAVRALQPWADAAAVRAELDAQLAALLGPRTVEDDAPMEKPKKTAKEKAPPKEVAVEAAAAVAPASEVRSSRAPAGTGAALPLTLRAAGG